MIQNFIDGVKVDWRTAIIKLCGNHPMICVFMFLAINMRFAMLINDLTEVVIRWLERLTYFVLEGKKKE